MKAGRELDRKVAETVMGWRIYHYSKGLPEYFMLVDEHFDSVILNAGFREGERATKEEAWNDCPRFSEDLGAALQVMEKIGRVWRGFEFMLYWWEESRFWRAGWFEWEPQGPESRCVGESESLAEAICLAALAIKEAEALT